MGCRHFVASLSGVEKHAACLPALARTGHRWKKPLKTDDEPGVFLKSSPEDRLQVWSVSPRVNKSGTGDGDQSLIAPMA